MGSRMLLEDSIDIDYIGDEVEDSVALEGDDIVLECGGGGVDCSWRTPYDRHQLYQFQS